MLLRQRLLSFVFVSCFSTEKVETRIALYLAESLDDEELGAAEFTLPMSKKDLASYLGTTPETISRKFNDLEEKGYIKQITHKRICPSYTRVEAPVK